MLLLFLSVSLPDFPSSVQPTWLLTRVFVQCRIATKENQNPQRRKAVRLVSASPLHRRSAFHTPRKHDIG